MVADLNELRFVPDVTLGEIQRPAPNGARSPRASSPAGRPAPRWRASTTSASRLCHGLSPSTGWPSHKLGAIRKSGQGARDANLEEAALENSSENLDENQRRPGVAGQARDGELPGGDRRTPR